MDSLYELIFEKHTYEKKTKKIIKKYNVVKVLCKMYKESVYPLMHPKMKVNISGAENRIVVAIIKYFWIFLLSNIFNRIL